MTNEEIIFHAVCCHLGIDTQKGTVLMMQGQFPEFHTYQGWQSRGRQVQKGQKAAFAAVIWKHTKKRDDDGDFIEKDFRTNAYFFGRDQVK